MNVAAVRSRSIHRAYLAAGLAATALYFALPWNGFAQTLVYDAIGASAAAASFLGGRTGSPGERPGAFSYPAMDIVLLAALVVFAMTPTWRTVSYRYLAASMVLLIFADELYGISPGTYAQTTWLDAAWLLSYVLWGVAALHPSMRELSEPARSSGPRVSTVRLGLLTGALATAPAVLVIQ